MKLKEYQGKEILHNYGIKTPDSFLITNTGQIKEIRGEVVLKAQVLHGGRGKLGLIQFATQKDVKEKAEQIFKKGIKEILIEESLGTVDKQTNRSVKYEKDLGWKFIDTGEYNKDIWAMSIGNKELFKFLEKMYELFPLEKKSWK